MTDDATTPRRSASVPEKTRDQRSAHPLRRVVQYSLDGLLMLAGGIALSAAVFAAFPGLSPLMPAADLDRAVTIAVVVTWACWALTFLLLPVLLGRTPGMVVLGLKVVDEATAAPARPVQHVLRALCLFADDLALGLVGLVTITRTKRRQRIGDLAARTLVVRA